MIAFNSLLWVWRTEAAGRWYFLTLPEEKSAEVRAQAFASPRGFRSVRVEASIGEITWRTSVFPQNSGGYLLPVKADVRKRAGIGPGDEVSVTLKLM